MGMMIFRPGQRLVIPGVQVFQPMVTSAAAFAPSDLANLWAWWDVSTLSTLYTDNAGTTPVTTSGDPIGYIADRSENSRYIRQVGSVTTRPTYTTGVQNGLPAALFDGGDYLEMATAFVSQSTIIMAIRRSATVGATQGIIGNYHSTNTDGVQLSFQSSNVARAGIGTPFTGNSSAASVAANTAAIVGGRFSVTAVDVVLNSVIKTGSHSSSSSTSTLRLGTFFTNAFSQPYNGYVGEVCIYNRALSDSEIGQLQTYLNTKWSVY